MATMEGEASMSNVRTNMKEKSKRVGFAYHVRTVFADLQAI